MTVRRKFFLIFVFGLFNMLLLIGFLVIRDEILEYNLRKEIKSLDLLNISEDRFNSDIKTRGDYALVEEAIKTYLDNYAVSLQSVLEVISSDEYNNLLSVDNYKNDGPSFVISINYIENTKRIFNENIDMLILNSDKDNISNYIYTYIDDSYFVSLYNELMFEGNMILEFDENKDMLEELKINVNNNFDVCIKIYNFLKFNSDNWHIENNEIKFKTNELLDQYNSFVSEIK